MRESETATFRYELDIPPRYRVELDALAALRGVTIEELLSDALTETVMALLR